MSTPDACITRKLGIHLAPSTVSRKANHCTTWQGVSPKAHGPSPRSPACSSRPSLSTHYCLVSSKASAKMAYLILEIRSTSTCLPRRAAATTIPQCRAQRLCSEICKHIIGEGKKRAKKENKNHKQSASVKRKLNPIINLVLKDRRHIHHESRSMLVGSCKQRLVIAWPHASASRLWRCRLNMGSMEV